MASSKRTTIIGPEYADMGWTGDPPGSMLPAERRPKDGSGCLNQHGFRVVDDGRKGSWRTQGRIGRRMRGRRVLTDAEDRRP